MDTTELLISIIMPVYNSEKYVAKAIESIISQSFEKYEIVIVNDGSTDSSMEICESFSHIYKNILLINKMNGGLCSARNVGIECARGKYILFLDDDDEIYPDSLNTVWKAIIELKCDILRFNRTRIQIFDHGKQKIDIYGCRNIFENGIDRKCVTNKEFFGYYRKYRKSGCFSGIWNGIYRRELFSDISFDEDIKAGGEDWLVNLQLYSKARKIGFINESLYIYYRRESHSISTTFQTNRINAIIKCANYEKMLIEDNGVDKSEILNSDVEYIAQIIKIMMHRKSNLNLNDKVKIIANLKKEPGFNVSDLSCEIHKLSILKRIYITLFKFKKYKILVILSEIILKIRGNT